jgi:hypothetical protein
MTPHLRKLILTAHVTVSVGWLGSVAAYLALAIAGLTSQDAQVVRAAYLSLELIGWFVIVPLSLATVLTGLVQSLGTEWGLFRHYWIATKFVLTMPAVLILLVHMGAVSRMAAIAAGTILSPGDQRPQRMQLIVHAAGGLLVLLVATTLSIYKPWGMTPYGRRKRDEQRQEPQTSAVLPIPGRRSWDRYLVPAVLGAVVLFVVVHLLRGGPHRH